MSVSRLLCIALLAITLIGALWIRSRPVATPRATPPTTVSAAATPDDDQPSDVADGSSFRPVASVASLMAGIGSAFGQLSKAVPPSEEEHRLGAIATWSEVLAELSNVNTRHGLEPDYFEMAVDTRVIALELARAARAETPDEARITTLFADLDNSCGACHDVY